MTTEHKVSAPGAGYARRTVEYLHGHTRAVLVPLGVLFVTERLVQYLWLGQPLNHALQDSAFAVPMLILVSVAVGNIGAMALRVAATALLLGVNYAQYTFLAFYGRFIGPGELRLAASNPTHELLASLGLNFSAPACLATLAATGAYAVIVFRGHRVTPSYRRLGASLLALLGWCLLVDNATPRQTIYSPVLSLAATDVRLGVELMRESSATHPTRLSAPPPARAAADFDVLYVLGESIRADRLGANAYAREVAPDLHSLKLPHIVFNNVVSHGDCTGRSVPLLMVEPTAPLYLDLYRRPTLFSYAKRAGYRTAFVNANDNDWKEFVDDNIDLLRRNAAPGAGSDRWVFRNDAEMLPVISAIANAPNRQFLVVETYAAHWPYADRYASCPQCRVYRPDLSSGTLPFAAVNRAKITNSYDNAVLYYDRFVSKLIGALKKPTLIVLTSDHGESLGEGDRWGHCSAAVAQMLVPFMLIATDESVSRAVGFGDMARKVDYPLSHANIFPTLLRILGYETTALEYRYAADLSTVSPTDEPARKVLVSEIGSGAQPASFGVVDANRAIVRWETVPPQ